MLSGKLLESIPKSIRIIRKFATESMGGHLTLQQFRVLKLISEGHGMSQIAEMLDVSMAAISKMSTFLLNQKLITRKTGSDKRTQVIKLTPKGKSTLAKIKKYVEQKLDTGIEGLSKDENAQLMQGLLILDKLMLKMKEV
jgi:DNA-binding MarR family transcriptional regulator